MPYLEFYFLHVFWYCPLKWKLFVNLNQLFSKHSNEILFSLPPFSKMQCFSRFLLMLCLNISFSFYTPNPNFIRMYITQFTSATWKQSLKTISPALISATLKSLDLLDWGIKIGTKLSSSGIFWQEENMPYVKRREIRFLISMTITIIPECTDLTVKMIPFQATYREVLDS